MKFMAIRLKWLKNIFNSVFSKLVLISLVTWGCIIAMVAIIFFASHSSSDRYFHTNVAQYFSYVIEDLGSPPSEERAKKIYRRTGLKIQYTSQEESWSLIGDKPSYDKIRFRSFAGSDKIMFGGYQGRHFLKLNHDQGEFLFEFACNDKNKARRGRFHKVLFVSLTFIVIIAFWAVKRVLRPIKWLHEGVQEVGRGNLAHNVPDKKKDEFGELASSFNVMTGQLRRIMTQKEHLLRDVSHELRSPLTRMKLALEFVDDEEARNSIGNDIAEMEAMITGILETARLHHDHGKLMKNKEDLSVLVKKVVASYKNSGPGVVFDIPDKPCICIYDKDQIKIVLSNVFNNSIKYSPQGSKPVQVSIEQDSSWIKVNIQDFGTGIEQDLLPMLFEPFFRADKSRSKKTGGYGLGLSLCKTIMEAHGGKIEIQSGVDRGTLVTICLPLD